MGRKAMREPLVEAYARLCEQQPQFPNVFDFLYTHRVKPTDSLAVELLLVDQQYRFQHGIPLSVEEYLQRIPRLKAHHQAQLALVQGELASKRNAGGEFDLGEVFERFPHLQEQILTQLSTAEPTDTAQLWPETPAQLASPLPYPAIAGTRFAGYTLLQHIGEGGMGLVFKARDEKLQRIVALKMIRTANGSSAEVARLLAEARAIARLEHESIVRVYELGESKTCPYFSMEFVNGKDLSQLVYLHPVDPHVACSYLIQACDAVAFAHRHGILHRDLKPSNLLRRYDGVIKVADFGLSQPLDNDETQRSGQLVGTPSYMAPEQARGEALTPAADVYSLGATLYHLVTGRPPFQAASSAETIKQILESDPIPARTVNPTLDRDLDTICAKCLEKNPERRYRSVDDLAADLRRYLDGRPVQARPIGPVHRLYRWCRRKPRAAIGSLFMAGCVLLSVALAVNSHQTRQLAVVRDYHSRIANVRSRLAHRRPGWRTAAWNDLSKAASMPSAQNQTLELRSLAAEILLGQDVSLVWSQNPDSESQDGVTRFDVIHAVAFSPDGTQLASGNGLIHPGTIDNLHILDVASGKLLHALELPESMLGSLVSIVSMGKKDGIRHLSYSPDGRYLAAGMRFGRVYVWQRTNGVYENPWTYQSKDESPVVDLAFSADGQHIFVATERAVTRWLLGPAIAPTASRTFESKIRGISYTPHDQLLVQSAGLHILEPTSLETVVVEPATDDAGAIAFDASATLVAGEESSIVVRQFRNLQDTGFSLPPQKLSRHSLVHRLELSPEGAFAAAGRNDGSLAVWSVPGQRLIFEETPAREHCTPAFSPDGRSIAASGLAGVNLYSVDGNDIRSYIGACVHSPVAMRVSPTGRFVASIHSQPNSSQAVLVVWDLLDNVERYWTQWEQGSAEDYVLEWAADDTELYFGVSGAAIRKAELDSPSLVATVQGWECRQVQFAPDGSAWSIRDNRLMFHETAAQEGVTCWTNAEGMLRVGKGDFTCMQYDAGWCVLGSSDSTARLFDCTSMPVKLVKQWPQATGFVSSSEITRVALSTSAQAAASGSRRGRIEVIAIPSGQPLLSSDAHPSAVTALAFSGQLFASGSADGSLKLWKRQDTGYQLILQITANERRINALDFARDDVLLIARDGESSIERLVLGKLQDKLRPLGLAF